MARGLSAKENIEMAENGEAESSVSGSSHGRSGAISKAAKASRKLIESWRKKAQKKWKKAESQRNERLAAKLWRIHQHQRNNQQPMKRERKAWKYEIMAYQLSAKIWRHQRRNGGSWKISESRRSLAANINDWLKQPKMRKWRKLMAMAVSGQRK